jgi:hypothetical protein
VKHGDGPIVSSPTLTHEGNPVTYIMVVAGTGTVPGFPL